MQVAIAIILALLYTVKELAASGIPNPFFPQSVGPAFVPLDPNFAPPQQLNFVPPHQPNPGYFPAVGIPAGGAIPVAAQFQTQVPDYRLNFRSFSPDPDNMVCGNISQMEGADLSNCCCCCPKKMSKRTFQRHSQRFYGQGYKSKKNCSTATICCGPRGPEINFSDNYDQGWEIPYGNGYEFISDDDSYSTAARIIKKTKKRQLRRND